MDYVNSNRSLGAVERNFSREMGAIFYPRGQILDQWLDQFIGIDLFSTNNSGARRRFKGG